MENLFEEKKVEGRKDKCVSCGGPLEPTNKRYIERGNYCSACNNRAAMVVDGRLTRAEADEMRYERRAQVENGEIYLR